MSELPKLHKPETVAESIGCSVWWLKEQCRRRRIPFVMVGGAYRFRPEHVTEIIQLFEQRPDQDQRQTKRGTVTRRRAEPTNSAPVVQLQARQPRRARKTAG